MMPAGSGVVTYGIVGLPDSLDPHNQAVPNDFATRMAFDSLLRTGDAGEVLPALAEQCELVDERTWQLRLRQGVRFASGAPLDAEAVVWNFQRLQANPRLLAAARIPTMESCTSVDRVTVRFTTRGPDAIWPRRVLQVAVADPACIATFDEVRDPGPDAGTGLFRITGFRPGQSVTHEAAEDTWRGRAELDGLRMLPYDPAGLLDALVSGDADFGYLSGAAVAHAERAGLCLQRVLQSNVHMIRFNSTRPPFDDPRLREAVTVCLDPQRIVAERYLGEGRAADQLVGKDCFGHDPKRRALPADLGRARSLVDASNWSGSLRFDILESSAVLRPWGEAAVDALRAAGLDVEPQFVDLPTYLGKLAANRPLRGDLIGAGNQYGPGMDAEFSLNKFSARQPPERVEYDNAEFQRLYDAGQATFDQTRRLELLRAATAALLDDYGCVPVYQPALCWLINPRVQGLRMNTIGAGWVDWLHVRAG